MKYHSSLVLLFAFLILSAGKTSLAQTRSYSECSSEIHAYVDFIKQQDQTPVDYVMSLFETHDIVILCERVHLETTQYDMIFSLLSDQRFIEKVGHVFTETGSISLSEKLDTYLTKMDCSQASARDLLLDIYRNLNFHPVWNNTNFYDILQSVNGLNMNLEAGNRIHIYPSDIPFSWENMSKELYSDFRTLLRDRDKIMADQVRLGFDSIVYSKDSRKKALVIMNYRHAFPHIGFDMGGGPQQITNFGGFLMEAYPGKVANVMINSIRILAESTDNKVFFTTIQDGKWDASFEFLGNPELGFPLLNSPFGKDSFDFFPMKTDHTYQDIFTGMIFFKPIDQHLMSTGIPGMFTKAFSEEVIRRKQIVGDEETNDALKAELEKHKSRAEFGYENRELFGESDYKEIIQKWLK